ncbi:MAG: carbon-nitrogen hydrolase family protein [Planctomycetota bacterium]|nr:MAG: carbon-nitrogen hydrolase family protein [Planctomycetota bacterium]
MAHRFALPLLLSIVACVSSAIAAEKRTPAEDPTSGRLLLATCQFPVSADVHANAEWIRKQMRLAAAQEADLVHFSECALSGYAGVEHESLADFDWEALRAETAAILKLADELDQWVVLGSTHQLTGEHKPHNSLYVINPQGEIVDRYDKRFCTGGDLKHFSPGDHFVVFEVDGVRCGLLICYDIRFPELYREYQRRGVQLMLHAFHNAMMKPGVVHPIIMPATGQARAATNGMFISMNNSCAPEAWPSLLISPDGRIVQRLAEHRPGVMVHEIDTNRKYYDASAAYRRRAMDGTLNSGEVVDDPRSDDRTGY